jgi:hypothetical protein
LFDSGAYKNVIRQGETVLFLPFGAGMGDGTFWQAETGAYFRMTNGYGNFTPAGLKAWPAEQMFESGGPGPDFTRQLGLFAHADGFDKVIVPEALLPAWNAALTNAGWTPQTIGNLTVFSISPKLRDATPELSSREARYMAAAAHFAALRAIAACALARGARQITVAGAGAVGCVAPYVTAKLTDPYGNWDTALGWVGSFANGVGLGVVTDAVTADRIVAGIGAGADAAYFPYPEVYHTHDTPTEFGQLLLVFPQAAIEGKTMK